MTTANAREMMKGAWATRRRSFSTSGSEQEALINKARRELVNAVEICRKNGPQHDLAQALHMLANVESDIGRYDVSLKLWEEAVSTCRDVGDTFQLAHKVRHLGDLHFHQRRLDEAETCYLEVLQLYRDHDDPPKLDFANALTRYAKFKEIRQLPQQALQLWSDAREIFDAIDLAAGVEECSRHISRLSKQHGS